MTGIPGVGNATICPFCRQPLPKIDEFPHLRGWLRRAIVHALMHNPGIGAQGLIDIVYANDLYGNPPTVKTIHVTIAHMRKQLRMDGYEIDSSMGRGGGYRLRRIRSGGRDAAGSVSGLRPLEQKLEKDTA